MDFWPDDVTCDFDAMRHSAAFLNDLADNGYRREARVRNVVIGQRDLFAELHFYPQDSSRVV